MDPDLIQNWLIGDIRHRSYMVPVHPELYAELMLIEWNEAQKNTLQRRCRIPDGKGLTKVCRRRSCSNCPTPMKTASPQCLQDDLKRRCPGRNRHSGVHTFSGKIKCGQCGGWYGSKVWHSNDKYRRMIWQCNHKYDGCEKCSTPVLTDDEIKERAGWMFRSGIPSRNAPVPRTKKPQRKRLFACFNCGLKRVM